MKISAAIDWQDNVWYNYNIEYDSHMRTEGGDR